jgi:hypothetical protein
MLAIRVGDMSHLDEDEIERYSMGRFAGEELDRCDDHLLICEPCRRQVERTDVFLRAIRGAAAQSEPLPRMRRNWFHFPQFLPVSAALAALLAIAWFGGPRLRPTPPAATVLLTASRGYGTQVQAPSGAPLALQPDLTGIPAWPSYRLEVVDASGARQWQGAYPGSAAPKMRPGVYFVRLYSPRGELYREYGLEIQVPR